VNNFRPLLKVPDEVETSNMQDADDFSLRKWKSGTLFFLAGARHHVTIFNSTTILSSIWNRSQMGIKQALYLDYAI